MSAVDDHKSHQLQFPIQDRLGRIQILIQERLVESRALLTHTCKTCMKVLSARGQALHDSSQLDNLCIFRQQLIIMQLEHRCAQQTLPQNLAFQKHLPIFSNIAKQKQAGRALKWSPLR